VQTPPRSASLSLGALLLPLPVLLLVVRAALANALLVRSGGLLFELVPVVALLLVLLGLLVLVLVVLVAVAVLVVVVALAVLVLVVAVRGRAIGVGRSSRGASSAR
jgi:hypothetical protein